MTKDNKLQHKPLVLNRISERWQIIYPVLLPSTASRIFISFIHSIFMASIRLTASTGFIDTHDPALLRILFCNGKRRVEDIGVPQWRYRYQVYRINGNGHCSVVRLNTD